MKLSRRDFAKLVGMTGAGAAIAGLGAGFEGHPHTAEAAALVDQLELLPELAAAEQGSVSPKDATHFTRQANTAVLRELDFTDTRDFDDAAAGFIRTLPDPVITNSEGEVWNLNAYAFLDKPDAPETVNPSLWRQARLNMFNGLFKVVDGVYQWRGFDMSNMTIIEGNEGIILIDPLMSNETAKAGLDLYYEERGIRPVKLVMYTHSHADHYGGVKGVVDEAQVGTGPGKTEIWAPEGFLEAAVSENVMAGNAMMRRANYMYGTFTPRGERGQVDVGLGKAQSTGRTTLIPPTSNITFTGEKRSIDGVEMEFQLAPGSEAPAEMMIYFPQFKMLDSAELACATLHNTLTMRGAQVRDATKWASYLNEAIALFGDRTEVAIAQHHWPRWGKDKVLQMLASQRDLYKFIHDQALRLLNHGYTMIEIAEMIELPDSLSHEWYNRGYYGTLNHDTKAVYQKYIGWYDANPANLHALPPEAAGKKYVEYMGGPQAVIKKARADFLKGDYRWAAQVLNHVVFAYPNNVEARNLEADALEQLGYQAEAATWRNAYLTAAYELRNGKLIPPPSPRSADTIKAMTEGMFFDFMGVQLKGLEADGKKIVLNWNFTDVNKQYALNLENCALTYMEGYQAPQADATLTLERKTLDAIITGQMSFPQAIATGAIQLDGDPSKLVELLNLLDTFTPDFNIITP